MNLRHQMNKYRHARLLATVRRTNSNCSRFMRNRAQLDALIKGPVIEHVRRGNRCGIHIVVLGCSYGPEPVSIASLLLRHRPEVEFEVDAYDIDQRSLEFARRGVYEERHVHNHDGVESEFVDYTFRRSQAGYAVKEAIRDRIEYHYGDATDDDLGSQVGPCDIVYAQHFLYHLPRKQQKATFRRIADLLPAHGVLFADGMDLDLRQREVEKAGLQPLDHKIAEIHACSRQTPWANSWPYNYYGLEPMVESGNWKTRYATIFTRS